VAGSRILRGAILKELRFTYDVEGRRVGSWVDADGYDDAGREVSVSDGVTAYQYQYDLADQVTYTDNAGSVVPEVTLSMAYDYEGNRTWLSDNLGGNSICSWAPFTNPLVVAIKQ